MNPFNEQTFSPNGPQETSPFIKKYDNEANSQIETPKNNSPVTSDESQAKTPFIQNLKATMKICFSSKSSVSLPSPSNQIGEQIVQRTNSGKTNKVTPADVIGISLANTALEEAKLLKVEDINSPTSGNQSQVQKKKKNSRLKKWKNVNFNVYSIKYLFITFFRSKDC